MGNKDKGGKHTKESPAGYLKQERLDSPSDHCFGVFAIRPPPTNGWSSGR